MVNEQIMEGDCFEANFEWLMEFPGRDQESVKLCHGKVVGAEGSPAAGGVFMHCWIEINESILDFSNGKRIIVPKQRLIDAGRILEKTVHRYSWAQAAYLAFKHKHYGAWEDELLEGD